MSMHRSAIHGGGKLAIGLQQGWSVGLPDLRNGWVELTSFDEKGANLLFPKRIGSVLLTSGCTIAAHTTCQNVSVYVYYQQSVVLDDFGTEIAVDRRVYNGRPMVKLCFDKKAGRVVRDQMKAGRK